MEDRRRASVVIGSQVAVVFVIAPSRVDSNLDHRIHSDGASPLASTLFVDVCGLIPSIIDGF